MSGLVHISSNLLVTMSDLVHISCNILLCDGIQKSSTIYLILNGGFETKYSLLVEDGVKRNRRTTSIVWNCIVTVWIVDDLLLIHLGYPALHMQSEIDWGKVNRSWDFKSWNFFPIRMFFSNFMFSMTSLSILLSIVLFFW